jgi:hypothetical protein
MLITRSATRRLAAALVTVLSGTLSAANAHADPAPASEAPPQSSSVYTKDGLLGSFRLGPTIGAGAPDGIRVGLFTKWRGIVAAGGAFSLLPETRLPGVGVSVARVSGEGFARVHPFRGAFFLGIAGGYAQTRGAMSEQTTIAGQPQHIDTRAHASSVYVAPHLGFQWMLPMGLTIGFDAGLEIPVASTAPRLAASSNGLAVPIGDDSSIASMTRFAASVPVPVVHLLEIGYLL